MKKHNLLLVKASILLLMACFPAVGSYGKAPAEGLELWFRQPAKVWTEALPIGNGRLGAMIFGHPGREHLQFNEETLWDGYPREYQREGAFNYLGEIRQLLFDGKQAEAEKLAGEQFMGRQAWVDDYPGRKAGEKAPFPSQYEADYQPFGDLWITFPGHNNFTGYRRSLDLSQALSKVSYRVNGIRFEREYFASRPDDALVVRLKADRKKMISFSAKLTSPHRNPSFRKVDGQTLVLEVKVEDGVLKGVAWLRAEIKGGILTVTSDSLVVTGADEAILKLVAATSFKNFKEVTANPEEKCSSTMRAVAGVDYKTLINKHIGDYAILFNRFSLDLGGKEKRKEPIDVRIKGIKEAPDNDLAALYVQYSRYLLLASSREGTMPPNLQGIWNDQMRPPWGSKYTTNINTEMNMWGAEMLNLPECHDPLFRLIEEVAAEGAKTAKAHYNARGWVLHHNTDLWRGTAPINASNHGIWVTGGAWLCHHLWEHYQYSHDLDFLRNRAYPLIRGAALFFVDFLVPDPKTGFLISTPSNSPEIGGLVAGPTMDHQIIRSLFKIVLECSAILNTDQEFAAVVKEKLDKLAPYWIGKHGQLQEWMQDVDDINNKHRHVSHLWGVYPGSEITADATAITMQAAKQSLIYRGDPATGWSLAWKINYWARFQDGEHAHKLVQMLLAPADDPTRDTRGGSYPNLFDAHPPFQIDGNFGGGAGIAEMLMQSHQGYIHLLPALPAAWKEGHVHGLRARGGFLIDMFWKNGKVTWLKVTSQAGQPVRISVNGYRVEQQLKKGEHFILAGL